MGFRAINFLSVLLLLATAFSEQIKEPKYVQDVPGVVTSKYIQNALEQTFRGRALLTWPNKIVNREFRSICRMTSALVKALKLQMSRASCQGSVFRSITKTGASGGTTVDKLAEMIYRVTSKHATPNDRMVCITTLGDIAQAMVDSQTKPKPTDYSKIPEWNCMQETYKIILKFLERHGMNIAGFSNKVKEFSDKVSANHFTKNQKRKERANGLFKVRKGIYDQGEKADERLKSLGAKQFINPIGWPIQKIEENRLNDLKSSDEPWAGHITGSGPECLLMIDLFNELRWPVWIDYRKYCKKEDLIVVRDVVDKCKTLQTEKRRAIAAIVLAFLQGAGFHSAFENHLIVNIYLGYNYWPRIKNDPKKTDTGHTTWALQGRATPEMNQILRDFTDQPRVGEISQINQEQDEDKKDRRVEEELDEEEEGGL